MPRNARPAPPLGLHDLVGTPWAMTDSALRDLIRAFERGEKIAPEPEEADDAEGKAEALGKVMARGPWDRTSTYMRGSTAVVPFIGPAMRYSSYSYNSYDLFADSFTAAIEDPEVAVVVLEIDSPGGEVNGCDEAAGLVFAARGTKPIIACVTGDACSAAYWVASAADSIVCATTATLGSIGVVGIFTDASGMEERFGVKTIEIVSSQSPGKRPDPSTKAGREALQTVIDDTASVFVASVARNRGITTEDVLKNYGAGGVMVGQRAVEACLADEIMSFESLLTEVATWDVQVSSRGGQSDPAKSRRPSKRALAATIGTVSGSAVKLQAIKTGLSGAAKIKAEEEEAKKAKAKAKEAAKDDDEDMEATASEDDDESDVEDDEPPVKKPASKAKKASAAPPVSAKAAEKARLKAILTSDEAEGREELAEYLAYDTDFSVKQALTMLGKAPLAASEDDGETEDEPEADTRAAGRLGKALKAQGNPERLIAATQRGKAPAKNSEDMTDDELVKSVVAFAAPYGFVKA